MGQRLWRGLPLPISLRAEGPDDYGLVAAAVLDGLIEDWSVMRCQCLQVLG
jgi:hypothetical protein